MAEDYDIVIDDDGTTRFIYTDELAAVFDGLPQKTERASHVEPHPTKTIGWIADMSPSNGPVLGFLDTRIDRDFWPERSREDISVAWAQLVPFATREEALAAELHWLKTNRGL